MTTATITDHNWWLEDILSLGEDVSQRATYWFAPAETVVEPESFIPSPDPLSASTSSTEADLAAEAIYRTRRTWQVASRQSISPLGQRLLAIRARVVASGEPLLNWDDLEREIRKRRGGQESSEE